ncbi:undecaprenyl-diphosphate phosphatase [Candidatus Bipolaricaulota bacterium]
MIRYLILGVVQGATEFLPVSSSGHLVLFQRLLGLDPPGVLLEALLHWGTLAAILVVFRSDLAELARSLTPRGTIEDRKEIGLIAAGTVPIVVVGLVLRSSIGGIFGSTIVLGSSFLATGILLGLTGLVRRREERNRAGFPAAVGIGLAQAAALLPGLSRSGATISAGLFAGMTPRGAARFSFLLAIPALFGAGLLNLWDVIRLGGTGVPWLGLAIGTGSAFFVGLLAIKTLLALVSRGRLWTFSIYCLVLGVLVLSGVAA